MRDEGERRHGSVCRPGWGMGWRPVLVRKGRRTGYDNDGTRNTEHWPLATDGHRPSTQGHIVSDLQVQPGQLRRTT